MLLAISALSVSAANVPKPHMSEEEIDEMYERNGLQRANASKQENPVTEFISPYHGMHDELNPLPDFDKDEKNQKTIPRWGKCAGELGIHRAVVPEPGECWALHANQKRKSKDADYKKGIRIQACSACVHVDTSKKAQDETINDFTAGTALQCDTGKFWHNLVLELPDAQPLDCKKCCVGEEHIDHEKALNHEKMLEATEKEQFEMESHQDRTAYELRTRALSIDEELLCAAAAGMGNGFCWVPSPASEW